MAWVANSTPRPLYPQQRNPVPNVRRLQYHTPTGFRPLDRPVFSPPPMYQRKFSESLECTAEKTRSSVWPPASCNWHSLDHCVWWGGKYSKIFALF